MLYRINKNGMNSLQKTTFEQQGLKEREVQDMLKNQINIIAPDTLIVADAIPATAKKAEYLFEIYDGTLKSEQFREQYRAAHPADSSERYFMKDEDLFHVGDKTYAFSNQWGVTTLEAVDALKTAFPELNINYERAERA